MAVIFKEPKTREAIEAEADAIAKIKVQIRKLTVARDAATLKINEQYNPQIKELEAEREIFRNLTHERQRMASRLKRLEQELRNCERQYKREDEGWRVTEAAIQDLEDKLVGVAEGSTSKDALIAAAAKAGVTLTDTKNIQTFPDYPSIKAALDAGQVQAFCVDGSILTGYLDAGTILLTSIRFSPQYYGIVTKLSNKGLAGFVDNLVKKWLADGTIAGFIADNKVPPSYVEK